MSWQASRQTKKSAAAGITRVWPQRDEGAALDLQEPGSHVGIRSEHLIVKKNVQELGEDRGNEPLSYVHVHLSKRGDRGLPQAARSSVNPRDPVSINVYREAGASRARNTAKPEE